MAGSETYPSGEGDLKFASVADIDGYKGIAVFTSENLLLNWAKSPCQFMKVKSQDVLTFCKTNRIDRIVIDTANRQSCILDWGYCNAGNNIIGEATSFEISIPIAPLSRRIIQKLSSHFKEVYPIKEAYQFLVKNDEVMAQAIGLHLSVDSAESRIAARNAIGRSFEGENHPFHFEVMILNDDCLRQLIPIQCTLFYKVDSV